MQGTPLKEEKPHPSTMMVLSSIPPAALYQVTRALSSLFQFLNDSQFELVVETERNRRKMYHSSKLDTAAAAAMRNANNNSHHADAGTTAGPPPPPRTIFTTKKAAPQATTTTTTTTTAAATADNNEKDANAVACTNNETNNNNSNSSSGKKKKTQAPSQPTDQLAPAAAPLLVPQPHLHHQQLLSPPLIYSPWPHPMLPLLPFVGAFPLVQQQQQQSYAAAGGDAVVVGTTNTVTTTTTNTVSSSFPDGYSRAKFHVRLQQIQDFKREYGHTRVPNAYSKNDNALGFYVNRIRQKYRTGTLHPDQIVALNELVDFDWSERRRGPEKGKFKKKTVDRKKQARITTAKATVRAPQVHD
jgi:Helicase associated domain